MSQPPRVVLITGCSSGFGKALAETLRMEVRSFGIHVSLIEPGDFATHGTANRKWAAAALVRSADHGQLQDPLSRVIRSRDWQFGVAISTKWVERTSRADHTTATPARFCCRKTRGSENSLTWHRFGYVGPVSTAPRRTEATSHSRIATVATYSGRPHAEFPARSVHGPNVPRIVHQADPPLTPMVCRGDRQRPARPDPLVGLSLLHVRPHVGNPRQQGGTPCGHHAPHARACSGICLRLAVPCLRSWQRHDLRRPRTHESFGSIGFIHGSRRNGSMHGRQH